MGARPAGHAPSTLRRRRAPDARCSSAAASASRRSRSCRTSSLTQAPAVAVRALLGFRDRERARGRGALAGRRSVAHRRRLGRERAPRDRAARARSSRKRRARVYACGPAPMLEAVRALCAERVRARASSRSRRRWRAASAPATAAPWRGAAAATCASASTGPCSTPALLERVEAARRGARMSAVRFCGLELAHPIVNGSGTFDVPAARRGLRRRLARGLPLRRVRLEDDHARAARRQPAAAAVGGGRGPDQLHRAAERGLAGYLERDLPELATLPVPLITNVMGATPRRSRGCCEACEERPEIAAVELNVSCPNVAHRARHRRRPGRARARRRGGAAAPLKAARREAHAEHRRRRRRARRRPRAAAPTPSR